MILGYLAPHEASTDDGGWVSFSLKEDVMFGTSTVALWRSTGKKLFGKACAASRQHAARYLCW